MALNYSTEKTVHWMIEKFFPRIVLVNSFGSPESMVLFHMVVKQTRKEIPVVTIDTGRLPQETYDIIDRVRDKYNKEITILFPDREAVEKMVTEKGTNLFYGSVENRQQCCSVRKVDVLNQYFSDNKIAAYISGLRPEHGGTREHANMIELGNPVKINPLVGWTTNDLWHYIREHNIPVNKLNRNGYPSVGCAPCSRAIKPGEDIRAGRWWWEREDVPKECGLHYEHGGGI